MAGYAKVFSSIVTSSLWCMEHAVLRIWIAMLTTCNSEGVVEGSIPGFASLCRVTIEEMEKAVQVLSSPDPHSRTQDFEGRRIEVIPGGWRILNYKSYRDKGQEKEGSKAPFMRASRQRAKARQHPETVGNALPEECTSYPNANANAIKEKEVRPTPSAPASTPPDKKKPKRVQTTCLKPDAIEAFEAIWSTPPKTFPKWDRDTKAFLDEPVHKGSRLEAERAFQAVVDAGVDSPKILYAAFFAYITEGEGPKKGFFQAVSTFFGPKKATYLEWLDRGRQLAKESA